MWDCIGVRNRRGLRAGVGLRVGLGVRGRARLGVGPSGSLPVLLLLLLCLLLLVLLLLLLVLLLLFCLLSSDLRDSRLATPARHRPRPLGLRVERPGRGGVRRRVGRHAAPGRRSAVLRAALPDPRP